MLKKSGNSLYISSFLKIWIFKSIKLNDVVPASCISYPLSNLKIELQLLFLNRSIYVYVYLYADDVILIANKTSEKNLFEKIMSHDKDFIIIVLFKYVVHVP